MTVKRLGIISLLVVLAAVLVAVAWVSLHPASETPAVQPVPVAVREQFHATKPLRLQVLAADEQQQREQIHWLRHELNHLLNRGRMRLVADQPDDLAARSTFTLRVTVSEALAALELLAPDERSERHEVVPLPGDSRLAPMQALARHLPAFLDAVHSADDWRGLIGTDDAAAYEAYLAGAMAWAGPESAGLTHPPPAAGGRSRALETLEGLLRTQPQFARGWGVL